MSCDNSTCQSQSISVVAGQTIDFTLQILNKKNDEPISLSGFTGATAFFAQESSESALAVTGSLVSEDLAKVSFGLTPSQSELLKVADDQTFEVQITRGSSEVIIAQIKEALSVAARLF